MLVGSTILLFSVKKVKFINLTSRTSKYITVINAFTLKFYFFPLTVCCSSSWSRYMKLWIPEPDEFQEFWTRRWKSQRYFGENLEILSAVESQTWLSPLRFLTHRLAYGFLTVSWENGVWDFWAGGTHILQDKYFNMVHLATDSRKSANQKSQDFCRMFLISKKKARTLCKKSIGLPIDFLSLWFPPLDGCENRASYSYKKM